MTQFSPVFILASFTIVLATPSCPNGAKPFFGTGRGANEAEARQNANIEVAKELYGSLKLNASDILTQRETDDDIEEIATYLREIKIETQLPNTGDVKDVEYPYKKENGQFVANRYICPDKAANPYLDSLKLINLEFSHKKISLDFCKDLYKTYGPRVMSFEQILERLEQKGKAQVNNYKEIEKECGKMGKGLFLKTDNEASELDKEFTKSLMGIINFKQGACLRGIEVQLVKAKEPNCKKQSMGGFWECSTDVSLEGIDCSGNGKTLTLDGRVSGRANNEERATQGMLSKLRKCDFPKFDAWKKELQPWMEK